jgi:hypothetical protein
MQNFGSLLGAWNMAVHMNANHILKRVERTLPETWTGGTHGPPIWLWVAIQFEGNRA